MTDVYIDGGGVLPDQELPDGTRVVFRTGPSGCDAVTAYVQRGKLVIKGQYHKLDVQTLDANTLTVEPRGWKGYR